MAGKYECERIERLLHDGRLDEALMAAMTVMSRDGGDDTGRIYAVVEQIAEKLPEAALAAAMTFSMFDRKETKPGSITTFYEMAIAGDDDKMRALAAYGYGRHLISEGQSERRGIRLIRIARNAGVADAAAELGRIIEEGLYGEKVDLDECLKCYVEATEGGSGTGMFLLAKFMLAHTKRVGDYHPMKLIEDAAELGHPEAVILHAQMVEMFEEKEAEGREEMLPYVVVPDGLERIKLVRSALQNEFSVSEDEAGDIAAALHGYPDWSMMATAADDPNVRKGRFDEECEAAEFNERERLLAEVFAARTGTTQEVAAASIKLLRPTSRTVRPSLRRLDKIMDNHLFKGMSGELGQLLGGVLEEMGMPTGSKNDDALRTVWPLQPTLWMDLFARHGWNLRRRNDEARSDGDQVCVTETSDGRLFKVFMSVVSYDPGDLGDEMVEALMKTISQKTDKAVLIFNHPRINLVRGSMTRAAFYGGRVLNNGEWWDFMLRESDGIDDALRQKGLFIGGVSPAMVSEYAIDGAVVTASEIVAKVTEQESMDGFGVVSGMSDWSFPVPPAAIKAARLIREVGSIVNGS